MRNLVRTAAGLVLAASLAAVSCDNPEGFVEPTLHRETVVDLYNFDMDGQQQAVFRVTVLPEPDMVHPHLEGRWTFTDNEKPIDIYVIPAQYFDPNRVPADQDSIFWSSLQDAVVGQQRQTSMHLHPRPGEWVIVFYNSLPYAAASRSRVSSEIDLTYFK